MSMNEVSQVTSTRDAAFRAPIVSGEKRLYQPKTHFSDADLANHGFVVEGRFEDVTQVSEWVNGIFYQQSVRPVIISENLGTPDESVKTVFRPRRNM